MRYIMYKDPIALYHKDDEYQGIEWDLERSTLEDICEFCGIDTDFVSIEDSVLIIKLDLTLMADSYTDTIELYEGSWIVKSPDGLFFSCDDDIFNDFTLILE